MRGNYDFIVIGGGSAGYAAASTVRKGNRSVAIVDGAEDLGGLCIRRGCMPSKTLIYIAEVLHQAKRGNLFGLEIPSAEANLADVKKRKERIIGEFTSYRVGQLQSDQFDLYRSEAKFLDEKTVLLADGRELTAEGFLVSTGSVIHSPPLPGLNSVLALTSDEVLDLHELPKSVIVLGGGIVACELAQYLRRMGSEVIQIQRSPRILKEASAESAAVVMQAFRDEGIQLFTGTRIEEIRTCKGGICVRFDHNGVSKTTAAEHLFNALGRVPNTGHLHLERAGVERRRSGHIKCNEFQQSTNPRVYAAGDCAGPHEIVHVAILQAEVAAEHFLGNSPNPVNYEHLTKILFTDPQVATVGIPVEELERKETPILVAEYPFADHGKSILMEAIYGYVKVWATPESGRVLGAECVGKDAGELVHSLAVGVSMKANVFDLIKTHWYHPTLSEIWTYPLEEIAAQLLSLRHRPAGSPLGDRLFLRREPFR